MENIIVDCPHCKKLIIIQKNEIHCAIFRHGVFITNNLQMDPHTPKHLCDEFAIKGLIYGCGKPFKLIKKENDYKTFICDYI